MVPLWPQGGGGHDPCDPPLDPPLVLKTNSYPNRFIHATRRKLRAKELSGARQQQGTSRQQKPLIVLPYIRGVTEKVTRVLKMHARVSTKPGKSLRNLLVSTKDKRDKLQNTGLVYRYECQCKKVYVGETGRSIKAREVEHKRAIRNMDENHSGVSKHVLETGHCIARDEVKILAFESDWQKRKIKEGIFIEKARGNVLNTKPGVPVANVYRVLK